MSDEPDTAELAYLEEQRKALLESVAFWSSERKQDRELWVVQTLLRHLDVTYSGAEVVSAQSEPPDVIFRDAAFEIKEVLDPDRRRHQEYRQKLEKAKSATRLRDLMEQYTPSDLTYEEVGEHVLRVLDDASRHYAPNAIENMDLLVYVNLLRRIVDIHSPVPVPALFAHYGWRSISVVRSSFALVLHAEPSAPTFLKSNVGIPLQRGLE